MSNVCLFKTEKWVSAAQAGFSGREKEGGEAANGGSDGFLGTWADRQTRFDRGGKPPAGRRPSMTRQPSLPAHIPGTPQELERPPASLTLARPNPANGKRSRGAAGKGDGACASQQADGGAGQGAADANHNRNPAKASQAASGEGDEEEAEVRQAAWRWRFNRRWVQEQARQLDPEYGLQVNICGAHTHEGYPLAENGLFSSLMSSYLTPAHV